MKLITLFFTLFLALSCSVKSRKIASIEDNNYRIGVIEYSEKNKLVLLGVEATKSAVGFDATELKFKPYFGNINNIDPKFLISINSKGVQRIYVFEYGNSSRRRLKKAMESEDDERRFYLKIRNRDKKPKLPKLFIDVPDVKLKKAPLSYSKVGAWALRFTPFNYVRHLYTRVLSTIETKKSFQASYLIRLIEMATLENKFPELVELIGKDELYRIGGAVRIRYEIENQAMTTWLTNNHNKLEMFRDYIYLKDEFNSENMSKLVERANEEGLIVMPVANDMAFLYYDMSERIDPTLYDNKLLSQKKIDEFYKKYAHLANEKSNLLPLGLFLMGDEESPTEGIDFNKPSTNINNEKAVNVIKFAFDIGINFIPIQFVSTAISTGSGIAEFIIKKSGRSQMFKKRIHAEAQMTALFESGTLNIDASQVVVEALIEQLKELDIDEDFVAVYKEKLESKDEEVVNNTFQEIQLLFSEYQTNKRKIVRTDGQYRFVNKVIAWNRLKEFTKNEKSMKTFNDWLNEREGDNLIDTRYVDRIPSSLSKDVTPQDGHALRPAIVFMIGGLTPSKIQAAIAKGHIPNLEKYFVKQGVKFDTFATQPLGLPSQASILTGWSIDKHGLRSDSPISRFDKKPKENLLDSRKEWVTPKYFDKSRSYRHIEESGATWFLDVVTDKNYTYFNSMPIYNGGSSPLGQYVKQAVKEVPRFFNGLYAHELVMDKASAKKTLELVRKSDGRYKLFVNWYRCAQTFSKKSNRALYQCLKKLDSLIGEILVEAQKDPVLKFADLYLISDAGQIGGSYFYEKDDKVKESFLNNTGMNLTKFFAGDFNSHPHYVFPVATFESPDPDYDLKFLHEFYIEPFRYLYRGKNDRRKGKPVVMVDYFGDAQARVYFKHKTEDWKQKCSFYDLTNFARENNLDKPIDIIDDLLNFKLKNTAIVDASLRKHIKDLTGHYPIKWIAYDISKESEVNSVKSKLNLNGNFEMALVLTRDKGQAIFISRVNDEKQLEVRLVPIKNWTPHKEGFVEFEVTKQDPFGVYSYNKEIINKWVDERVSLKLLKDFKYPVLFSHFGRIFRLAPNLANIPSRVGEIPDLLLYANDGFNFNSSYKTEADRGYLDKRSSKISFYHGSFSEQSLDSNDLTSFYENYQLFERDIAPFIMYRANPEIVKEYWEEEWNSQLPLFNEFYHKRP